MTNKYIQDKKGDGSVMNESTFYTIMVLLAALYLILDENDWRRMLGWLVALGTGCVVGGMLFLQKVGML